MIAPLPTGLGHDLGLPEVLLGVEDIVGQPLLLQEPGEQLGLGHRGRAHQNGLALLVALDEVLDHGVELGLLGLEDEVGLIGAHHLLVGRDGDHGKAVGAGELPRLGLGGTGHAGQLLVHAEVVLQGDRGPGVVLLFDGHPFLGLDGLVEAVGPAPAFERAPGELVDDLHFAARNQVVPVSLVEILGGQGLGQLVHVVGGDRVVDVVDPDRLLHLLDAQLERHDGLLLLVDLVVHVPDQRAGDGGELVVQLRRLIGGARNDERGPRLIDQDGVDLVDDGKDVTALDHVLPGPGHVVAQVVESELVVGTVRDVGGIGGLLRRRIVHVGADPADGQAEPAVEPSHPLGVTGGQVVVDGHHMDAPLVEGVEVDGQRGDEGLSLPGLHLGDPPEVQRHAAHELDVEMTLPQHPPGCLPHHGVGLDQEVVERLALVQAFPELHGLVGQLGVAERLHLGLQGGDGLDELGQATDLLTLARLENFGEDTHEIAILPVPALPPVSFRIPWYRAACG